MRNKKVVSSEIVQMYEQGYSCKDICTAFNLSAVTVRNYLQLEGFNTRHYRKVSENNKAKIILLIETGYSYKQIEKLLHTSTHLIREVAQNSGFVGLLPRNKLPIKLEVQEKDVNLNLIYVLGNVYRSGVFGLAKCAAETGVSDKEFLWFVYHLTQEDIKLHNEALQKNVLKLKSSDVPVTAIAKSLDISPSIAKKMVV